MEHKLHIAVDAMGGDAGVAVTLPGAIAALESDTGLSISLFGDAPAVEAALGGRQHERLDIRHCSSVVEMDERPASVLRHKSESSMAQAIESHQRGETAGVVSAGNTAALVALGLQSLEPLPGVSRPALCCYFPNKKGRTWMLDMGATLEPDIEQLVQFARMGSCQARIHDGIAEPRLGLLNVGAENYKGTSAVRELAARLESCADIHYCGFAEGVDLCSGRFDVIVCDGFSGNVALKAGEGVSSYIGDLLVDFFTRGGWLRRLALLLARKDIEQLRKRMDPSEFNGAPLLGLNGLVVKSRGGTDARGFCQAILLAANMARSDTLGQLQSALR